MPPHSDFPIGKDWAACKIYCFFFCALNPSPGAQLMWSNEMIADILPNGQLYTSKLILKVLTTALGQTPLIECNRSAKLGYSQFYQIYVCVDKDGKSLIPCPVTIPNQCRAIVYFPPFWNFTSRSPARQAAPTTSIHNLGVFWSLQIEYLVGHF